MKFLYSDEPIIACSTCSHANAALAVLRISGFQDVNSFKKFLPALSGPIEPRRVYYTKLVLQGQLVDDICLTYFEGPRSFNGENILELSIHGNTLNIERVLDLFVTHGGCREASAGEFTYRALKNKKLSLSQVEGLDLFLNANSQFALGQGMDLLSGNLHAIYLDLLNLFLIHKSSLELSIDFSDDVGEETARKYFRESLENFSKKFQTLVKRVAPIGPNLIQPEIVLAGLPNSGKSSLFNHLLSEDRAIVSAIPGTTRDYLTENLMIEGVKYKLVDTAGIRNAIELIESEGIKRTKEKLKYSFFSILLVNPFEMVDEFSELLTQKFDLIYFTHADLPRFEDAKTRFLRTYPDCGPIGAVNIKALSHSWDLELYKLVNNKYLSIVASSPILLERHKSLILQLNTTLLRYIDLSRHEEDVGILSMELNSLGHCISELIGIISPDDILDSLFSNFCIGK
ncbi:MAG TPA: GTPase [Bacteriovoracaceae bacterium]|nr:GTPase [Bacteriovoracaceae bacterium]